MKERCQEMGILQALGERKLKIVLLILSETTIIGLLGFSLCFCHSEIVARKLSEKLFEQQRQQEEKQSVIEYGVLLQNGSYDPTNAEGVSISDARTMAEEAIQQGSLFQLYGYGLGVLALSSILPMLFVLKEKPRKTLL